ncbi:MAG TPA: hypothetical protein VI998_03790 [Patescibacteria group bacterium]|nr:hypothetical protein [Patescibacteria group bacterium]
MNILPKIKIKKDLKAEANMFQKFLHHPYYLQNRNFIFQAFPELEIQLKKSKNEKGVLEKFIANFHKTNKDAIDQIIKKSNAIINKKGGRALVALSNLMDYKWSRSIIYKAIPTILPFSPFGNNIFYFSILGQIKGKNKKDALFIAIHEISHFIFYDILKEIEQEIKKSAPDDLKNYLKETLTAALLNRKPLSDILNLHNYKGNPEIRDLQIKKSNGAIVSFTEFIDEYYQIIKVKNKKTFKVFLQEILNVLLPISKEFSKKRAIWNRYGNQLYKKPSALNLYQKPIQIKKG